LSGANELSARVQLLLRGPQLDQWHQTIPVIKTQNSMKTIQIREYNVLIGQHGAYLHECIHFSGRRSEVRVETAAVLLI
jgi:hypothetical protein